MDHSVKDYMYNRDVGRTQYPLHQQAHPPIWHSLLGKLCKQLMGHHNSTKRGKCRANRGLGNMHIFSKTRATKAATVVASSSSRTRVYALDHEETKAASNVVEGRLIICDREAGALFDPRSILFHCTALCCCEGFNVKDCFVPEAGKTGFWSFE